MGLAEWTHFLQLGVWFVSVESGLAVVAEFGVWLDVSVTCGDVRHWPRTSGFWREKDALSTHCRGSHGNSTDCGSGRNEDRATSYDGCGGPQRMASQSLGPSSSPNLAEGLSGRLLQQNMC